VRIFIHCAAVFLLWSAAAAPQAAASAAEAAGAGQHFKQGVKRYGKENYKKAIKAFEKAVETAPDKAEYHLWLGRAYGRRAENLGFFQKLFAYGLAKKVRASFERAVELDGDSVPALSDLMQYYLNAPGFLGGGVEKAESVARRIAELDEAAGLRAWASIHKKQDQYEAAEEKLRRAIKLEPDNVGHKLSLASLLARQGRLEESDRLYAEAAEQAPDPPEVWYSRAEALVETDRKPERARRLLRKYLRAELPPNSTPRSQARKLLGKL